MQVCATFVNLVCKFNSLFSMFTKKCENINLSLFTNQACVQNCFDWFIYTFVFLIAHTHSSLQAVPVCALIVLFIADGVVTLVASMPERILWKHV